MAGLMYGRISWAVVPKKELEPNEPKTSTDPTSQAKGSDPLQLIGRKM